MPRSFDIVAEYDGPVDQVHRAFGDERYWLARLADSGVDHATLDSLESGGPDAAGGPIRVKTTQMLRVDRVPPLVTQFHPGDLKVEREETWGPVRDGRSNGTGHGIVPGLPVELTGTALLAPAESGTGSRLEIHATVEVRIPLLGGSLENVLSGHLADLFITEQRFTALWITENT